MDERAKGTKAENKEKKNLLPRSQAEIKTRRDAGESWIVI